MICWAMVPGSDPPEFQECESGPGRLEYVDSALCKRTQLHPIEWRISPKPGGQIFGFCIYASDEDAERMRQGFSGFIGSLCEQFWPRALLSVRDPKRDPPSVFERQRVRAG